MDKISKFRGNLQLFYWHLLPLFFGDSPPNSFGYMAGGGEAPSVPMAVPHITAPGQDRGSVAVHYFQPSAIGIHFNQLTVVANVFDSIRSLPYSLGHHFYYNLCKKHRHLTNFLIMKTTHFKKRCHRMRVER